MKDIETGPVEVRKLFSVPVMVTDLADVGETNKILGDIIRRQRSQSKGIARSNVLGWHSDTEMLRWGGEAAKSVAFAMLRTCGARTDDVGMTDGPPRYEMAMEMWANVSPPGASNQLHAHPGCIWSGVYYVDDGGDEDSKLILIDPNYPMNRMYAPDLQFVGDGGERFPTRHEIAPKPGRMVIFPSWLNHSVRPHRGPGDRISIAMNVMAIPVRQGAVP